jgi:hypothetical protein
MPYLTLEKLKSRAPEIVAAATRRHGNVSAVSNAPNGQYVYQRTDMDAYEVRERLYLPYAAEG